MIIGLIVTTAAMAAIPVATVLAICEEFRAPLSDPSGTKAV